MSLKKDKQKVLGETFDDERVKGFLNVVAVGETDPDFTALERAYRGMKEENFETFVKFFTEEGRNINSTNANGDTFLQVISTHRHAGAYITALKNAGAR
ncbi:hypothetical protein TDB9533_02789 [Thalassocella blandensis]|nr:hypothetical protein TDB9533_02789 [Thalassocella blandensis]